MHVLLRDLVNESLFQFTSLLSPLPQNFTAFRRHTFQFMKGLPIDVSVTNIYLCQRGVSVAKYLGQFRNASGAEMAVTQV
eukprot:COSAG02_NODE_33228_length_503_cov_1.106436_1_plen_79_part_10